MATYRTTIRTDSPPVEVFDYLARFSSAVHWDPGVVQAKDLTPAPVRVGSAFLLTVRMLGRDAEFRYEVVALDHPQSVTLRAETGQFVSTDTIGVVSDGMATIVTYEAHLETSGLARLLSPLLPFAFKRIGDRAAAGLQRELDLVGTRLGSVRPPTGEI